MAPPLKAQTQKSSGHSDRHTYFALNAAIVDKACHRWLMERDPEYRRINRRIHADIDRRKTKASASGHPPSTLHHPPSQ